MQTKENKKRPSLMMLPVVAMGILCITLVLGLGIMMLGDNGLGAGQPPEGSITSINIRVELNGGQLHSPEFIYDLAWGAFQGTFTNNGTLGTPGNRPTLPIVNDVVQLPIRHGFIFEGLYYQSEPFPATAATLNPITGLFEPNGLMVYDREGKFSYQGTFFPRPGVAVVPLWAKWSPRIFNIQYDFGEGTGWPSDIPTPTNFLTHANNGFLPDITLNNLPTTKKPGWTFLGFTHYVGGGDEYGTIWGRDGKPAEGMARRSAATGREVLHPGPWPSTEDPWHPFWYISSNEPTLTLVAHWTETVFTVTYDYNGGMLDGLDHHIEIVGHNSFAPNIQAPIKLGYTFLHWGETPDAEHEFDWLTLITGDLKLYAVWQENFADIVLNARGGEFQSNLNPSQTVQQETIRRELGDMFIPNMVYPTSEIDPSYVFWGWATSLQNALDGIIFLHPGQYLTVTRNITLFAIWSDRDPLWEIEPSPT